MTINSRAINTYIDETSKKVETAFELYKAEENSYTKRHLLSLAYDRAISCLYIHKLSKEALYSDEDKRRWDSFTYRSMKRISDMMVKIKEETKKLDIQEFKMSLYSDGEEE